MTHRRRLGRTSSPTAPASLISIRRLLPEFHLPINEKCSQLDNQRKFDWQLFIATAGQPAEHLGLRLVMQTGIQAPCLLQQPLTTEALRQRVDVGDVTGLRPVERCGELAAC